MHRFPIALALVAATAAAQDHILPLGFADNLGPTGPAAQSFPVARVKDGDLDGLINNATEQYTFLSTSFGSNAGRCFMVDSAMVLVNGEPEFYFVDALRGVSTSVPAGYTFEGRVVRGVDKNHNGLLDRGEDANGNGVLDVGEDTNGNTVLDTEVNEYCFLGTTTATNLFTPDAIAVYRDNVSGRTRVYLSLDNGTATSGGFTHGIWRFVDNNGDGDAKDAGESSIFVSNTMGLTVPGNTGPVALGGDFYTSMRVLPGGKLIAYSQGLGVATGGTLQPGTNCFFGFTDNNGVAVPEVWFNCSNLNTLPRHPDWVNGTFQDWDAFYNTGTATGKRNFARWIAVAPHGGPFGIYPAYYIASSYNVVAPPTTNANPGDLNQAGNHIAGLVYRVVDLNNNQAIDAGELSLFANLSTQTYNGVAPVGFTNQSSTLISTLTDRTWGVDVTDNGEFSFLYFNGGRDCVVSMADANGDNMIDQAEIKMVYSTPLTSAQYGTLGAFFTYYTSLQDGLLPGPFANGIATTGSGCATTARGLNVVMDAWGGSPQIGNTNFKLGSIRGVPFSLSVMALGDGPFGPFPISGLGFPNGCTIDISNPQLQGFAFTDANGRTVFSTPIPNNIALIGITAWVQCAAFDVSTPVSLQYHTTNALAITIQP